MTDKKKNDKPVKEQPKEAEAESAYCPIKADILHRFLAKFIDFLFAGALMLIFPFPIGFLAGLTYLLIADGLPPKGQSLGKRLIGLRVVVNPTADTPGRCAWKQSIIRNIPVALVSCVVINFLGVLIFLLGLVVMAFETYFVFADDQGVRLGDIFANTKVLDQ